ncbi:transglycosylase family protein [Streptomyces africanus]|uniref:LysM peptidoglycan-binding domain-containing protein n=1 Tax=Streptomyces africanus TaxID=231024 RepID=UPI000A3BA829|nr:transglycosylase family protein [Streptomyces africanus]
MLSGNGRHRRPRQAPALLVAAGVTGSAIAIPLLGASGASAADGTTWDRVADCETGGAWSQNSGNGYFGGLQLSQEDWENHGGLDYAPSADLASRSQQIAVAERILADQGVGAWRTCGLLSGLEQDKSPETSDSSAPTDSPGLLDSVESPSDEQSTPEDETTKSDKSPDSVDSSTQDPSPAPESDKPDNSPQGDDSSAPAATGTETGPDIAAGRHRGPSADEGTAAEDGRTSGSAGRHASRAGEASREATDGSYTVRPGDSLWSIANSLDLSGGWHALYVGNETAVGTDPNLIRPGQKLTVKGEADEK